MRLLRARGSGELGQVASGSATQGKKVAFQVVGEDWSRFPGRGTVDEVGKVGRWERRAIDRTEGRVQRFRAKFRREESMLPAMPQPWLWQWQTRHVGSRNVNLTIFNAYMSGSKSLHLSLQQTTRLKVDGAEGNGKFGRIQCQKSKESSSRGTKKWQLFLCRRIVRVEVKDKLIPKSSLKIYRRGSFVVARYRRLRNV